MLVIASPAAAGLGAQFRTVIAVGYPTQMSLRAKPVKRASVATSFRSQIATSRTLRNDVVNTELFDGILRGEILEKPIPLRIGGFPFESLFYIPEWKLVLGETRQLPAKKKTNFSATANER